jgi:hypothetical protein
VSFKRSAQVDIHVHYQLHAAGSTHTARTVDVKRVSSTHTITTVDVKRVRYAQTTSLHKINDELQSNVSPGYKAASATVPATVAKRCVPPRLVWHAAAGNNNHWLNAVCLALYRVLLWRMRLNILWRIRTLYHVATWLLCDGLDIRS